MARSGFLWVKHLCYALIALVVVVCLGEIGLRVYDSATGQVTRSRLYDHGLICKSWFVHHTLRPAQVFSVKHPDRDERIRLAINSFGFRGREPQIPKPAGVYRVVCLGDEQTFGQAVPLDETFPHRLAEAWRDQSPVKVDPINAAVPGYCPLLMYLQLKLQLGTLSPNLVIAQFDPSDISEDYACRRQLLTSADRQPLSCSHPDLRMKRSEGKLPASPWLLPELLKQHGATLWAEQMLTEPSRSIDSPQARYAWLEDEPPDWSVYIEQALEPLSQMQSLCDSMACDFVVVVVPAPWQLGAGVCSGPNVREQAGVTRNAEFRSERPAEILREYAEKHGIALIDLTGTFSKQPETDTLFWQNAAALSDRGHELVSRTLARRLAPLLPGATQRTPNSSSPPETEHNADIQESDPRDTDSTRPDRSSEPRSEGAASPPLARLPRPRGMARTESADQAE